VDVAYDIGIGQRKDVTVVENVLFAIGKTFAPSLFLAQAVGADGRPHRSIKNHDALFESGFEFFSAILRRHAANKAFAKDFGKYISTHLDLLMRNMQKLQEALLAKVGKSITLPRPMSKTTTTTRVKEGMEPAERDPAKLRKTAFYIVLFGVISAIVVLWNYSIASGKQNTSDRPSYHGNVFFNLKFLRQDGKIGGFDDLKGKVWIIQPYSATQPETCELSTAALKRLLEKYQDNDDIAFVSLVIDPGPAEGALKLVQQAADQQSAKLPKWWFGTTEPAVLHKYLKDKCRLGTLPHFHEGKWLYDSSLIVVDRDMKLRRAVIPQQKGGRPYVTGFDFVQAAEWDQKNIKTGTDLSNQQEMQQLLEKTIERLLAEKPIDAAP